METFAEVMLVNNTLREVYLQDNRISDVGCFALCKVTSRTDLSVVSCALSLSLSPLTLSHSLCLPPSLSLSLSISLLSLPFSVSLPN
jgi:hypothetical protein